MSRTALPVRLFRTASLVLSLFFLVPLSPAAHSDEVKTQRLIMTSEGRGADVLFIPGLASSAEVWRREANLLKDRYRVHLIQVRGFAGTDAGANANPPLLVPIRDELLAHIRKAGLKRPTIIGHSLGGLLAMMMADADAAAIGNVMIVDSLPFFGLLGGPQATVDAAMPAAARARDQILAQADADYANGQMRTMSILVKSKGPEAQAALVAAQTSDRRVVAHAMYEDWLTDMRPKLAVMRMKVVVLYAHDTTMGVPPAALDGMYANAYAMLPNRELVRIDGSYHFIQIDQAERFHAEVERLLRLPLQP